MESSDITAIGDAGLGDEQRSAANARNEFALFVDASNELTHSGVCGQGCRTLRPAGNKDADVIVWCHLIDGFVNRNRSQHIEERPHRNGILLYGYNLRCDAHLFDLDFRKKV